MILAFVIVVGLLLVYVVSGLYSKEHRNVILEAPGTDDLRLRKQEILAGLSDLEYDFQMKKMKEEDYRQEKEKLLADGAGILKKLEEIQPPVKTTTKKKKRSAA
jgi:hypothetical protein